MRGRPGACAERAVPGSGAGAMEGGPGPRIREGDCAVLKRGDVFKAVSVLRRR